MRREIDRLLSEEPAEVQEAVLELLKALREAKDKVDKVQILKDDAKLISCLTKWNDNDDDLLEYI